MGMMYKTYRAEVRGVDENEGTVDMFIPVSSDSVDRDGEIVEPSAFKKTLPKFMKRPVLVASHDYHDLTNQIGEWTKLKIGDTGMDGKPKYYVNEGNEQADWGFKLASKGMAAFSIGFIPKEWVDGDGVKEPRRTYKEVELLEISQVIVPSNREAIQSIRAKGVDPITDKLYEDILNDKEIIPSSTITLKIDNNTPLITKPEETDEYIRIPVDRGDHEGHRIRTIDISEKEGIKAIYCGTDKVVMTYLFAKDKGWTMAKARAWVKEHEKGNPIAIRKGDDSDYADDLPIFSFRCSKCDYEELGDLTILLTIEQQKCPKCNSPMKLKDNNKKPKAVSQSEIIDEIDYLKSLIEKEGLSEDGKKSAEILLWVTLHNLGYRGFKHYDNVNGKAVENGFDVRISGGDIPVKDMVIKVDVRGIPEVKNTLNEATKIIDDERIRLIIEQTIKNVVKNS